MRDHREHNGKKIRNWRDLVGNIAFVFHFPPSELWAMTSDDLVFWNEQAARINKERNRGR